jgi:hypothetical protein
MGIAGFLGPISMAYRLSPINLYILLGNAILGFFTGFFFTHLKEIKGRPAVPQVISVLAAYIIQAPYNYATDVYLMPLPSQVVLTIILPKLLLENIISALLCHFILFRIDIQNIVAK